MHTMIRPKVRRSAAVAAAALVLALVVGCSSAGPGGASSGSSGGKVTLRVLFAGSLIIPFATLEKEFEAAHPDIDVNMEGHGSIQAIRTVSDVHEQADVVVSADYRLIPMLMYHTNPPGSDRPYADASVLFSTNKMALAYSADSVGAGQIYSRNWYDIINQPGVRLGISDPRMDANGYRALMVVQLAQSYYHRDGLFEQTFGDVFREPLLVSRSSGNSAIIVPEILETKTGSHVLLRPYSTNLLPLISSGDVDYAFEYESVIRQHGLKYVELPPGLNLGDAAPAADYSHVSVKLDYQRFGSVKPEFTGEPIQYAATIPSDAPNPSQAAELLAFLLGPEGRRIMKDNYQPMFTPARTDNLAGLPPVLKQLCVPVK